VRAGQPEGKQLVLERGCVAGSDDAQFLECVRSSLTVSRMPPQSFSALDGVTASATRDQVLSGGQTQTPQGGGIDLIVRQVIGQ